MIKLVREKATSAKAFQRCGICNPRLKPWVERRRKLQGFSQRKYIRQEMLNRNLKVQVSDTTMLNKAITLVTK